MIPRKNSVSPSLKVSNNYWVIKVDEGFKVMEQSTGNVLGLSTDRKKMNLLCNHLNKGGGFDGFTPTFVLNPVIQGLHF